MNSIAQHAVPNGMGQSEFFRPQLTTSSIRVTTHRVLEQIGALLPHGGQAALRRRSLAHVHW
ncbi:MAG: hypothetical protein R3E12_19620 [Candidatus Eisenbacteria bacterium]